MSSPNYLPYDDIGLTIAVIAAALAFIVLVWNAVKAITEWRKMMKKPTDDRIQDHEQRISALEACCEDVKGKLQGDWEFQQDEKEFNRLMLNSIKQLLKHELDGNDTAGLEKMEAEIDEFLLKRAQ